jgi:hypothetical protein
MGCLRPFLMSIFASVFGGLCLFCVPVSFLLDERGDDAQYPRTFWVSSFVCGIFLGRYII